MDQTDPNSCRNTDIAIIGAGPIGLEIAAALKTAQIDYVHIDAGQVGQVIANFPPQTQFFSSNERIAIAGIPIPSTNQSKCRREAYLAYLRMVATHLDLRVQTYERVTSIAREDAFFVIETRSPVGQVRRYRARRVILCTGGTARHRDLGIRGEDLPHVTHELGDVHQYFRRKVLVVGGKNSAVEAALRCFHVGADVMIAYRRESFPDSVKYWLKPEIEMLIESGRICAHFSAAPEKITPDGIVLRRVNDNGLIAVKADHILLMIGYEADMSLFEMLGVKLEGPSRAPVFDSTTMVTNVPGVYVAGTATAGTQTRFQVYIENAHIHAARILATLTGNAPPPPPKPPVMAES